MSGYATHRELATFVITKKLLLAQISLS